LQVPLTRRAIDRDVSPLELDNPKRNEEVLPGELVERHPGRVLDYRSDEKGIDGAVEVFFAGLPLHGYRIDGLDPV